MIDKIDEIIKVVEENLDYEGSCHNSGNCEMYAFVGNKERVKKWIREIIEA